MAAPYAARSRAYVIPALVAAGTVQDRVAEVAPAANDPQAFSPVSKAPLRLKSIQPQTWPAFDAPQIGTVTRVRRADRRPWSASARW